MKDNKELFISADEQPAIYDFAAIGHRRLPIIKLSLTIETSPRKKLTKAEYEGDVTGMLELLERIQHLSK